MVFFDNQDLHLTNSQYTNFTLNSSLEGKERVYIENIQPLLDALNTDLNIHYFLIYFIMMAIYLFTIKIILDKNIQFDFQFSIFFNSSKVIHDDFYEPMRSSRAYFIIYTRVNYTTLNC